MFIEEGLTPLLDTPAKLASFKGGERFKRGGLRPPLVYIVTITHNFYPSEYGLEYVMSGLSRVTLSIMINDNTCARVRVLRLSILTATPSMRARVYNYICS